MSEKVTRQREWQKKQRRLGNCIICGQKAARAVNRRNGRMRRRGIYCEPHKTKYNEAQRRRRQRRVELMEVNGE